MKRILLLAFVFINIVSLAHATQLRKIWVSDQVTGTSAEVETNGELATSIRDATSGANVTVETNGELAVSIRDSTTGQNVSVETNGGLAVNIQDQHTPILIVPFHNTAASTTLTSATAIDDRVINVTSAASFVVGQYLTIYNITGNRFYQARVLVIATLAITVDSPLDFAYQIGDQVSVGSVDLNVNGSVTPQIFNLRLPEPGLSIVGDITRLVIVMETTGAPGWDEFGDLAALTRGIVLRKTDGTYENIFTAKTNSELAAIMYDFDAIDQARFSVYGIKGRLTFAGQNKIGVTVRLAAGEDLQLIVQDDLTSLLRFIIVAEGHVVTD